MVALSASAFDSPSLPDKVNARTFRKSAEIVALGDVSSLRAEMCLAAKDELKAAFRAPSHNQVCINAARMFGVAPDTVNRIVAGHTKTPDPALLSLIGRYYQYITDRPSRLLNLMTGAQ